MGLDVGKLQSLLPLFCTLSFHLVSCFSQTKPELAGIPELAGSKQLVKQWFSFRSLCLNDH